MTEKTKQFIGVKETMSQLEALATGKQVRIDFGANVSAVHAWYGVRIKSPNVAFDVDLSFGKIDVGKLAKIIQILADDNFEMDCY
jgi:hypothetical protein